MKQGDPVPLPVNEVDFYEPTDPEKNSVSNNHERHDAAIAHYYRFCHLRQRPPMSLYVMNQAENSSL